MKTRIKRLEIKNYRQYEHLELNFDDDKNLYAFMARNHVGKTNIINAISWCLYGDEPFKDKNENDKLLSAHLANNRDTKYSKIKVTIEAEIDDHRILYKRSLIETDDANLDQNKFEVFLFDNGDWKESEEPNPNYFVEKFLPKSLRYFFMFPGEDLKNLFTDGYEINLKKNVHIVSNVTLIEETIKHLDQILTETEKEETRLHPELGDVVGQLTSIKTQLKQDNDSLIKNKEVLIERESKIKEMRSQQDAINIHKELISRMRETEARLISEEDHLRIYEINYKSLLGKLAPFVFLYKELGDFSMNLYSLEDTGDLPPKVTSEFIEDLIVKKNKGKCICGNIINEASVKSLELLLKDINSSAENMYLYDSNIHLARISREIISSYGLIKELKTHIIDTKAKIDNQSKLKKELSMKISHEGEVVGTLEDTIRRYDEEVDKIKKTIWQNEQDILSATSIKKELEDKLKESEMSKKLLVFHSTKRELLEEIIKKYQELLGESVKKTRSIMSNTIRVYFKELFWDTVEFTNIFLNENYEIILEKNIGGNIVVQPLTQLSGGEKICLGYSLMKGLAELSGFSEVPVFIDGPISDIDEGVKETFLEKLPTFMMKKQLFIFFKADTSIERYISSNLNIIQAFRLEKRENGLTTVREWN